MSCPSSPAGGYAWVGDLLLCLRLFCRIFTHGLVTAMPSWSQGPPGWVSHLPSRAGMEPRVPSPAPAPWSQLSCWSHPDSCRDPYRDHECPEDLGREMVQSCLPGSHQNAKTNSHTSKEMRMEDDPRTQSGAREKEEA